MGCSSRCLLAAHAGSAHVCAYVLLPQISRGHVKDLCARRKHDQWHVPPTSCLLGPTFCHTA